MTAAALDSGVMVANLCAYVLQTTLFLGVGLVLPALFRLFDPSVRLKYWRGLLVLSLAFPLLGLMAQQTHKGGTAMTGVIAGGMEMVVTPGARIFSPWPWLLGTLAVVAIGRLLWVLAGLAALGRLRRRAVPLCPVPGVFSVAERRLDVRAEFRVSTDVHSPLTYGWRHPVVLLPEGIEAMEVEAQRCIALHELLHVKRADWPVIVAEETLRALLWFHPAVWLVLDRISLSREQVVDREVVRLTHERKPYMNTLAAMARLRQSAAAVAFLPFFHKSHLLQRLALLTKEVTMSKFRLGLAVTGSAFALLLAGAVAAGAFPLLSGGDPTPAAKPTGTALPVDGIYPMGSIETPKLIKQVNPVYPEEARQKGLNARVVLEVVINPKGEPTQIKVLKTENEIFNASAVDAVSQWRYESPMHDGKPVSVRWIIHINFTATK